MLLFNITGGLTLKSTKIPSVNEMYNYNRRSGKVYKSPEVSEYQFNIEVLMCKTNLKYIRHISNYISEVAIDFTFVIGNHRKFWGLDTSNMIKATEDSVVKITKFDDAGHRIVNSIKVKSNDCHDSLFISYLMLLNCTEEELAKSLATAGLTEPLEYKPFKDSIHYHSFMRRYDSNELQKLNRNEFEQYLTISSI